MSQPRRHTGPHSLRGRDPDEGVEINMSDYRFDRDSIDFPPSTRNVPGSQTRLGHPSISTKTKSVLESNLGILNCFFLPGVLPTDSCRLWADEVSLLGCVVHLLVRRLFSRFCLVPLSCSSLSFVDSAPSSPFVLSDLRPSPRRYTPFPFTP